MDLSSRQLQSWELPITVRSSRVRIWMTGLAVCAGGAALRLLWLDRFPPGLHFDEAVYGLLARDIYHGARPVFFPAYTGREPLYMYLMAMVFGVTGINALAIRLTSALMGLATIPLTYLLGRQLFGRRVGVLSAALVAISYWHLTVSRNGYPNILIPPLEILSLYFLWQGYARDRPAGFALGGLFAGTVLYTYLAARFFPVLLLAVIAYAALVDRARLRQRSSGIFLAATVAALTVAPLALYFVAHPHDFWERADQVLAFKNLGLGAGLGRLLLSNTLLTAGAFFVQGDPRWHYNLPGQPIFDPLLGAFFLLGLAVALRRWQRLGYGLILLWPAVMSLPAILTADLMPSGQRMFGVIPAIFVMAALGLDSVWVWADSRRPSWRAVTLALATLLLIFEGVATFRTYFWVWGRHPETYHIFNADYAQLAEAAGREMESGRTVVILSEHYKHPTVVFLAPQTVNAVWALGDKALPVPNRGESSEMVYLVPTSYLPEDSSAMRTLAAQVQAIERLPDPSGQNPVLLLRVPTRAPGQGITLSQPTINGEIAIVSSEVPSEVARRGRLPVTVVWRVQKTVPEGRTFALHLVDDEGLLWAQTDEMGYLSEQWRPGDEVVEWFHVPLDPAAPAGIYSLRLALTDEAAQPLPLLDDRGRATGLFVDLGDVTLTPEGGVRLPIEDGGLSFGAVGDGGGSSPLRAVDHDVIATRLSPGARVQLSVLWQALRDRDDFLSSVASEWNPRAILELSHGGNVWHRVSRPLTYGYPPSAWQAGEVVRARYAIEIPADAPPGQSRVSLSIEGLEGHLDLGTVTVEGESRLFEVPAIGNPRKARLGGSIEFLGYDLPAVTYQAGDTMELTLYWQATAPIEGDFKVFTHLLGPANQMLGQHDSIPTTGHRPTAGWAPGEIITDIHPIPIIAAAPSGRHVIEIGMYDPVTLTRLEAWDETGRRLPDDRILLTEVEVRAP